MGFCRCCGGAARQNGGAFEDAGPTRLLSTRPRRCSIPAAQSRDARGEQRLVELQAVIPMYF